MNRKVIDYSGRLGMHLGLPSLIASDPDAATIRILISEYPPSHDFSIQIRIQLAVARFSHVLLKSVNDDIDSSLVRLLDLELDELKEECSSPLIPKLEIFVAFAIGHRKHTLAIGRII